MNRGWLPCSFIVFVVHHNLLCISHHVSPYITISLTFTCYFLKIVKGGSPHYSSTRERQSVRSVALSGELLMKQGSYLWSHHDVASLLGGILHLGALMRAHWDVSKVVGCSYMQGSSNIYQWINDPLWMDRWIMLDFDRKALVLEMQSFEDNATSDTKSIKILYSSLFRKSLMSPWVLESLSTSIKYNQVLVLHLHPSCVDVLELKPDEVTTSATEQGHQGHRGHRRHNRCSVPRGPKGNSCVSAMPLLLPRRWSSLPAPIDLASSGTSPGEDWWSLMDVVTKWYRFSRPNRIRTGNSDHAFWCMLRIHTSGGFKSHHAG